MSVDQMQLHGISLIEMNDTVAGKAEQDQIARVCKLNNILTLCSVNLRSGKAGHKLICLFFVCPGWLSGEHVGLMTRWL